MRPKKIIAQEFKITGTIQGVGFRPFVYRLATLNQLTGSIRNAGSHVHIFAQGSQGNMENFVDAIHQHIPSLAKVDKISGLDVEVKPTLKKFVIEKSSRDKCNIHNVKDYAVCEDCLEEFNDPQDRRYHYAFIGCSSCGPRYSTLYQFPLDRKNTSYDAFKKCNLCMAEYIDPYNRRFHTQNISCPNCGPRFTLKHGDHQITDQEAIIDYCSDLLASGNIVCIKCATGYRIFCDAENQSAVEKLRIRKNRPHKPFAVMFSHENVAQLKDIFTLSADDEKTLTDSARPIVLLRKKEETELAENIAPGLDCIGILLTATGFEKRLLDKLKKPLIATSANLPGASIITTAEQAEKNLHNVADAFLHHDLDIYHGLDDSVFKKDMPVRLGRGYAPHERTLPFHIDKPVLALGAEMKNTITVAWKNRIIQSPHLGDMNNFDSWQNMLRQIDRFQTMYNLEISHYLVDKHPRYTANQWVKNETEQFSEILHHHAHASALAFEHHVIQPMLVFTWDGTGYGETGELWGGEAFYGMPGEWQRVASTRPFKLVGASNAIKEPWRISASLCWHSQIGYKNKNRPVDKMRELWDSNLNCPNTSSIGRLFDAAAHFLGLGDEITYDGQLAMELEALASHVTTDHVKIIWQTGDDQIIRFDWHALLTVLQDESLDVSYRAKVFHNTLAHVILELTLAQEKSKYFRQVGLTGGVFQNNLLRKLASNLLQLQGFEVLINRQLPANDAAISLGQIIEYGSSLPQ